MKKLLLLIIVGLIASNLLVGCGQGGTSSPSEEPVAEVNEMTATFVGLMDGSSFEVTTEAGEALTVRFTENHIDQLSTIDEGLIITFTFTVDENGQAYLEEILDIQS